jgi:CubicO group peptidase (beta-lactamase class C family)
MKAFTIMTAALSLVATATFTCGSPNAVARPVHAGAATTALPISTRIDMLVRRAIRDEHLNGAILVRLGPKVLLRKGYGMADPQRRIVNTPTTSFALPGMTGLFAAAAVEQLVEQGKLAARSVSQVRASRGSAHLRASIGLIERVSGESYATYLQRHMFGPLGMTHTQVAQHPGAMPEVSSTIDDLDRWAQAVLGCMLVSPQALFSTVAPGHQVLEAVGTERGAAAGERLVLSGDTTTIVLANQGADVRHLLAAIQNVLPRR